MSQILHLSNVHFSVYLMNLFKVLKNNTKMTNYKLLMIRFTDDILLLQNAQERCILKEYIVKNA